MLGSFRRHTVLNFGGKIHNTQMAATQMAATQTQMAATRTKCSKRVRFLDEAVPGQRLCFVKYFKDVRAVPCWTG